MHRTTQHINKQKNAGGKAKVIQDKKFTPVSEFGNNLKTSILCDTINPYFSSCPSKTKLEAVPVIVADPPMFAEKQTEIRSPFAMRSSLGEKIPVMSLDDVIRTKTSVLTSG